MAKIYNSVFGTISGKHGNAVAVVSENGTNFIRMYNPKKKDAKTEAQVAQRAKFTFSAAAITPFHNLFRETMGGSKGMNEGRRHAFRNAIVGEYPNYSIDYNKLKLSSGSVDTPVNAEIDVNDGESYIKWDFIEALNSRGDDMANVVIYHEESQMILHHKDVSMRKDLQAEIVTPEKWAGSKAQCWVYFTNEGSMSDSIYLGEIDATQV